MSATRTLRVEGMTCSHCVRAVTDEVSRLEGVTSVDVQLDGGLVTVTADRPLDDAELAAAVDEAGYSVAP